MARPKSGQTAQMIAESARRLFLSKGYQDTSYTDLAKASGVGRTTIQVYVPKKGILAELFLAKLRDAADERAAGIVPAGEPPVARQYVLGQIYLAAFLSCEESKRFLFDVLHDRTLMGENIVDELMWSLEYVSSSEAALDDASREMLQDVIAFMGGLYELLLYSVRTGDSIDIPRRLGASIRVLAKIAGGDDAEGDRIVERYALDADALAREGGRTFWQAFSPIEEAPGLLMGGE